MAIHSMIRGVALTAFYMLVSATSLAQAYQDYSNTTVKNDTGKPLALIAISGGGEEIGDLFITGKSATFDGDQHLTHGAGFLRARPGRLVSVVAEYTFKKPGDAKINYTQMQFEVALIEWDDDGKLIRVSGMDPIVKTMGHDDLKLKTGDDHSISVTKDGVLKLDFASVGPIALNVRFGYKATSVGNPVVMDGDLPDAIQQLVKKKFDEDSPPAASSQPASTRPSKK